MTVGRDRNRALRLAVIGTGALGSALLWRLAEADFSSVLLIDPDVMNRKNLPLSPFLAEAQHGYHFQTAAQPVALHQYSKVELLVAHAQSQYGLKWCALPCEIADVGWQHLQETDLLCCCTDSALSRAETAFVARALGKPVLDGAVFGDGIAEGRVTRFSPAPEAACYLCGMGEDRRAAVLGYAASAALGCRVPEEAPAMTGTLATLRRVADAMVSAIEDFAHASVWPAQSVAVKLTRNGIAEPGTHADPFAALRDDKGEGSQGDQRKGQGADKGGKLRADMARTVQHDTGGKWLDGEDQWHRDKVLLTRSDTCPWHSGPATLVPLPWEQPLCESLGVSTGREVQFDSPVCTEALCTACGEPCAPFARVAAVRRGLLCPHCDQPTLQPLRAVHRIRTSDALAHRSPRQLGQPDRHLYSVRCGAV